MISGAYTLQPATSYRNKLLMTFGKMNLNMSVKADAFNATIHI